MQQIAYAIAFLAFAACFAIGANQANVPQIAFWFCPAVILATIVVAAFSNRFGPATKMLVWPVKINSENRIRQYQIIREYNLSAMAIVAILLAALEWAVAQSQRTATIVLVAGIVALLVNVTVTVVRARNVG